MTNDLTKYLLLSCVAVLPLAACAQKNVQNSPGSGLRIVNERYVPEEIAKKYGIAATPLAKPAPLPLTPELPPEPAPMPVKAGKAPTPVKPVDPVKKSETAPMSKKQLAMPEKKPAQPPASASEKPAPKTASSQPAARSDEKPPQPVKPVVASKAPAEAKQAAVAPAGKPPAGMPAKQKPAVAPESGKPPVLATTKDKPAAPAKASRPAKPVEKNWYAAEGTSLQSVLQGWADAEGVALDWKADRNFIVGKTFNSKATFDAAVTALLKSYGTKKAHPLVAFGAYPDTGKRIIRITASAAR
jgi:hypothetical protein